MDKVTLIDKDKAFDARYAAPSITTGFFVASIVGSDRNTIETAFTNPGRICVHNVDNLYPDKTYTEYKRINELRENENDITVILDGEDNG